MPHSLNPECLTCASLLEFTFQDKPTCGCTAGWDAFKEGKCSFKNKRAEEEQPAPNLFSHAQIPV